MLFHMSHSLFLLTLFVMSVTFESHITSDKERREESDKER